MAKAKKTVKKIVTKKPLSALNDTPKKMIVSRLEIKATIPTRQYENIQPSIEFKDVDLEKGTEIAMKHINSLAEKYGEKGAFNQNTTTSQEKIKIDIKFPNAIKIKSFNEKDVEVDFDPVAHIYHYKGKELTSATKHTATFYKPFDMEKVAAICEKAWSVPKEEIIALWNSNGAIANELGTLIHKALEHSDVHRANGLKISEIKKDKVNPATLKHPILAKIIFDFQQVYNGLGLENKKMYNEILVTDIKGGHCGLLDRLVVSGKNKLRVQDYKVNIGAEDIDKNLKPLKPFETLPATKLTKYQIQMSIYANMLEKSGYEVEALDAFVLDEEWKHYKLPVLKVLN